MKTLIFLLLISFSVTHAASVQVSDAEASLLFRYVGAVVPLSETATDKILHVDSMMCSILFNLGNKKLARCVLPTEQVRIEQDNAVEITTVLQNNNMPIDFKLGYETRQAGLDCTQALTGDQYPVCYLSPKP